MPTRALDPVSTLCILLASVASGCRAQAPADHHPPPAIFYSDLLTGPATGGQSGEGAFVTLYGAGFGELRNTSTVTIGGVEAHAYPLWSDTRITLQLGNAARTGAIVVHAGAQQNSNALPFTVRPGHIYFVSPSGDDDNRGTFDKPWKTLVAAKDALRPGDIAYAMDGVQQATLDKYDSAFSIQTSGDEGLPLAIVAYPGAKVTIGAYDGPQIAARTPNIDRSSNHWVLAGLTFRGAQEALDITASADWRIIGNDFSCPKGFGPTGCIETGQANRIAFLGNHVHDVAQPGTTKVYHAVYFSTDSNHIDVGWNIVENVRGCRGIQFHSSPLDKGTGLNQYDLHVHDNVIHDVVCDGINFATVDPSKGPVEAYNNLIYNVGTGPDPGDGSADYACVYVQGGANSGAPGSGTVELYNNTMYNCGARGNSDSGAIALSPGSPQQHVRLRNNIIVLRHNEPLLTPESTPAPLIPEVKPSETKPGETNLVWSATGPASLRLPHSLPRFTIRDPLFKDPAHGDFTLRPGSPAIASGTPSGLSLDIYGSPRAAGNKTDRPDLGAIQHQPADTQ